MSRKKSEIWNHFVSVSETSTKCRYCSAPIKLSKGSTGNLMRHMKIKHPTTPIRRQQPATNPTAANEVGTLQRQDEDADSASLHASSTISVFGELQSQAAHSGSTVTEYTRQRGQAAITDYVISRRPLTIKRSQELDTQLIKMICKEYHPFSLVEGTEFQIFINMLCPSYKLPSRKTVSNSNSLIPQMYSDKRRDVEIEVHSATSVCLTIDGWTSINSESFMAITAHFINDKTKLKSYLLGCVAFNQKHTAENLCSFIKEVVDEWRLTHKVAAIVSDNAANITAAIRLGNWRLNTCFAHSLNLVVQTSLKVIKPVVDKVKAIVQYFKQSNTAMAKLKSVQSQMNLPPIKLKQDVVTRWNSTYDMLSRIIQLKEAVLSTLAIIASTLDQIKSDEWEILEKCTAILEIFKIATEEISVEKTISLSSTILFKKAISKQIDKFSNQDISHRAVLEFIGCLRDEMKQRFGTLEQNELVAQATLLDPRIKKFGFSNDTIYKNAKKVLCNKICTINVEPEQRAQSQIAELGSAPSTSASSSLRSLLWEDIDSQAKASRGGSSSRAAGIIEFEKYIQEPIIDSTMDPLIWWKQRRAIYPRLYQMVLRRLCISATSVPCERIFSKAGLILNEKRSRMKATKLSQVLFLNHNL